MNGSVVHIFVTDQAGRPLRSVPSARAVAGRGLEGDRYFFGRGTFDRPETQPDGRELSIIALEAIEECHRRLGIDPTRSNALAPDFFRRNVVVRGVDLSALVRQVFALGEVRLRGLRPAPPCRYLVKLVGQDLMKGLKGIGGLRAQILESGTLKVGDEAQVAQPMSTSTMPNL